MRIQKFEIRNFKGISQATIHLDDGTPGNVTTLIGLNESGKTTILEALSHFITEDEDTASLVGTVHQRSGIQDLIPKDKKAAFTGNISIEAYVELDDSDIIELANLFEKNFNLILDKEKVSRFTTVKRSYEFDDSAYSVHRILVSIKFPLRARRAKKFNLIDSDKANEKNREIWLSGVEWIQSRLPKVVYFPTFLFDFPERIYLEHDEENIINNYYRQVIQDVLDSQGEKLDVKKHIVDRIDRVKERHNDESTFVSYLFSSDEKNQIDAVLQKAANQMSKVIFGSWNEILNRSVAGKRIKIEWLIDSEKSNSPYIKLSIEDGQTFSLSERSLGFRWFFSFLLFTQFRKNRIGDGSTIFLFDEPAANLHSKAQMKLLESFGRIAQGSTFIFYSTHSHYMVQPLWLERAYIIENSATDYDDEDVASFSVRTTDISATRYKTFVGSNPSKTTYFQPVLDALDVTFSPLIRSSRAVIVEGKNDYFPFIYFLGESSKEAMINIFPGNGAGSVGPLISLFRGWGVEFCVILDGDKAGQEGKRRYLKDFLLSSEEVATLADIDKSLIDATFEDLYCEEVIKAVKEQYKLEKVKKNNFSLFFQELLISNSNHEFTDTRKAFSKIDTWIRAKFQL